MAKRKHVLVWVVLGLLIVAIIFSAILISKSDVTGKGILSFLKRPKVEKSKGILADAYLASGKNSSILKGYKAEYDGDGRLVYEVVNEGTKLNLGENYQVTRNSENSATITYAGSESPITGNYMPRGDETVTIKCSCGSGTCTQKCSFDIDSKSATCTGKCTSGCFKSSCTISVYAG